MHIAAVRGSDPQRPLRPTTCRWGNVACSALAGIDGHCLERRLLVALLPFKL